MPKTTKGRKTTTAPKKAPVRQRSPKTAKEGATTTPRAHAFAFRDRVIGLVRATPDRLLDHPDNWRVHPEAQASFLRDVLGDIGIAGVALAIIADDEARAACLKLPTLEARGAWLLTYTGPLMLTDGHLRKKTITQPIPTVVLDLTPEEARRALATHDTAGSMAETDVARLRTIVEGSTFGGDVLARLRAMVGPEQRPIDDDEEEPVIPTDALVKKWQTAPGQLWVVPSLTVPGREHRLLCGDCRDPANVQRLHEGARPDLGLHDPPYGVDAVSSKPRLLRDGRSVAQTRANDPGRDRRFRTALKKPFVPITGDRGPFDPSHLLGASRAAVLWGANCYAARLPVSASWVVWYKREGMSDTSFSDAELAWVTPGKSLASGHIRVVSHKWSGVCRSSEKSEERLHPTLKPIFVQRRIVEWYSEPGDLVADWYMGAGAVIIACEQTGRIGHGMDIAHAYLAATLERLSTRGLTPRLVQ